jgi:Mg-chelatase subunit ChlD
MLGLVTSPDDYVHATDFNSLGSIKNIVIRDETCKPITPSPTAGPPTTPVTGQPSPTVTGQTTAATTTHPGETCRVDVVFCIDNSGSIGNFKREKTNPNWEKLLEFVQNVVRTLNVGRNNTHVGIVDFGTFAHNKFHLRRYYDEKQMTRAISRFKYRGESTNTTGGLYFARRMLTDRRYGVRGPEVPKIIILITDGQPTAQKETLAAEVANIRSKNIRIVGVGVTKDIKQQTMLSIVTSPEDYVHATNFSNLDQVKNIVIREETCKPITPEPPPSPTAGPSTTPPPPPTAVTSIPPKRDCVVDMVLCIDNSASIKGGANWQMILDFAQHLVSEITVGPSATHIALVDFGYRGYLEFDLNKYQSEVEINKAIASLQYLGQRTNTTGGLYWARTVLTDNKYGPRDDSVPKIIVLITDGNPTIATGVKLTQEVQIIKAANIRIVTVSVTEEVDEDLMRKIATSERDHLHVKDFTNLDSIKDKVINEETCQPIPSPTPPKPTDRPTTLVPCLSNLPPIYKQYT